MGEWMSDLEKAARQALDALKKADKISGYVNNNNKTAIKALEAALAQQAEPVVEPEHWVVTTKVGDIVGFRAPGLKKGDKVYPHPQQQAEPLERIEVMRLRQKNAKQAEPAKGENK
jgi:hypothetical protein